MDARAFGVGCARELEQLRGACARHIDSLHPGNLGNPLTGRAEDFHDVEAIGRARLKVPMRREPAGGALAQQTAFLLRHGGDGATVAFAPARLDFNEENGLALPGDDVELAVSAGVDVAPEDATPASAQVARCPIFATSSGCFRGR